MYEGTWKKRLNLVFTKKNPTNIHTITQSNQQQRKLLTDWLIPKMMRSNNKYKHLLQILWLKHVFSSRTNLLNLMPTFFWPDISNTLANHTTTLSCTIWKLDECNNQNSPWTWDFTLLSATEIFVFFCFAFLAGGIVNTSHSLHISVPHGQSKQKLEPLLKFLISSKFGLYWQGCKSKYIYRSYYTVGMIITKG